MLCLLPCFVCAMLCQVTWHFWQRTCRKVNGSEMGLCWGLHPQDKVRLLSSLVLAPQGVFACRNCLAALGAAGQLWGTAATTGSTWGILVGCVQVWGAYWGALGPVVLITQGCRHQAVVWWARGSRVSPS